MSVAFQLTKSLHTGRLESFRINFTDTENLALPTGAEANGIPRNLSTAAVAP